MTLIRRITSARNEFYMRYGQYANAILIGPNAELELNELMDEMQRIGLVREKGTQQPNEIAGLRIFTTTDIQDFVVFLIHDHTL